MWDYTSGPKLTEISPDFALFRYGLVAEAKSVFTNPTGYANIWPLAETN